MKTLEIELDLFHFDVLNSLISSEPKQKHELSDEYNWIHTFLRYVA